MLALLLLVAALAHAGNSIQNVSLSLSALRPAKIGYPSTTLLHMLEMNWQPGIDADWIGLFHMASLQQISQGIRPAISISPEIFPGGYYRTEFYFDEQQYPNGWGKGSSEKPKPGDACLPYWIVAYKNNELIEAHCLKMHPTWMWDHRAELENMPLIGLFFPGTYTSVHYDQGSKLLPRETVIHFPLSEDADVWTELIRGIRYLDVDIGYCSDQNKPFSIYDTPKDGRFCMTQLMSVLKDVKEFLKTAKYEIVILDFHHFPVGFEVQRNLHREFVLLLYSELGDYILPFNNVTYNSTLNEVWHTGRNLIVAYNDSETTKEFGWLWGPLPRMYGDHQTTEGLKTFLQKCVDGSAISGTVSAAPALKTSDRIHDMVDTASRNITKWFHDYWWRHANLVASNIIFDNNAKDVNVGACLDKANNVIFQVASED